jgi:hypothetical protein
MQLREPAMVEIKPAEQLVHALDPGCDENVPGAHCWQEKVVEPVAAEKYPGSHGVQNEDPDDRAYVPALQFKHAVGDTAPDDAE